MKAKNLSSSTKLGLVIACSVLLTGCATFENLGSSLSGASSTVASDACTRHEQQGCLEVQVVQFDFDKTNKLMEGLDRPYATNEERSQRMKSMPFQLLKAYERGEARAAAPGAYSIYFWNIDKSVPLSKMNSWKLNGMDVSQSKLEDITATTAPPVLEAGSSLGKPDRVYRITTSGNKAAGTTFQAPWSFYTKDTVFMVYSERNAVYPGEKNGLWIMPAYLNGTMRAQNWKWVLFAFLHGDVKVTPATTVSPVMVETVVPPAPQIVPQQKKPTAKKKAAETVSK